MGLLANLIYILVVIQLRNSCSCASPKVSIVVDFLKNSSPVLKSAEINATDFPWVVAILKQENEGLSFLCSGTLIHSKFVVTAASCVVDLPPRMIKVGTGISLIHNPIQEDMNLKFENISEKYYPFHQDGQDQDGDLAILKLQNASSIKTPQLASLLPTDYLSKHCFSLGWGVKLSESKTSNSCPSMNMNNALSILYPETHQNQAFFASFLGFCSSLSLGTIFKNNLFNYFFSGKDTYDGQTCVLNDFSHLKLAKVSSKAKYHYKYLCAEDSLLCISGWNSTDLATKVDIGSPIFCKIKKPMLKHGSNNKVYSTENQFGLAGIITNKQVERIPILKYNSTMSVLRANNITHYAHFIFAVLKHNV